MKQKRPKRRTTWIYILILLIGLGLLLYPSAARYWNTAVASHEVKTYSDSVTNLAPEDYSALFTAAEDYNARLSALEAPLSQYELLDDYDSTLRVGDSPMMGVVKIDKIDLELPIYHGTSNSSLADGAGHMEGTSLPLGGKGKHTVLSAHRGLPGSRLFTDLDKMDVGDLFTVTVLDRTLTYEVDRVVVTLPEETQYLLPTAGEDYCTLLTCTPYGVNTHRLLVRGKRIDNIKDDTVRVTGEAIIVDRGAVALALAVPIVLILLLLTWIFDIRNRRYGY
ncbi:MAG: class C sortase [Ruminococcus sp.]|nr:class C sortase [Ruminococcus sp.]